MGDSSKEMMRPNIPHFFQPLISDFLSNFSIPRSFQKYLERSGDHNDDNGNNKKKVAILRDKGGKFWQVKVVYGGDDNGQKFKDGWETFCKDHSLKVGDFLVFKYHGNLIFDVSIFDPNACERQLSTISTTFETKGVITRAKMKALSSSNNQQRKGFMLDDIENIKGRVAFNPNEHITHTPNGKQINIKPGEMTIPMSSAKKYATVNSNLNDSRKPFFKLHSFHKESSFSDSRLKKEVATLNCRANENVKNGDELIEAGAKNSMKRNRTGVEPSKYPFCRMSVKSYWPKGLVYFPKVFSRENGLSNKRCEIMVIDEKDRSWSLLLRTSNRTNTYIAGWRPFHEANGLKTGDPVIFELIDSGKRPIMKFYTS